VASFRRCGRRAAGTPIAERDVNSGNFVASIPEIQITSLPMFRPFDEMPLEEVWLSGHERLLHDDNGLPVTAD
jgi:hypothetical protein